MSVVCPSQVLVRASLIKTELYLTALEPAFREGSTVVLNGVRLQNLDHGLCCLLLPFKHSPLRKKAFDSINNV